MPLEYISHCKSYLEERSLLLEVSGHRRGLLDHHGQRQADMNSGIRQVYCMSKKSMQSKNRGQRCWLEHYLGVQQKFSSMRLLLYNIRPKQTFSFFSVRNYFVLIKKNIRIYIITILLFYDFFLKLNHNNYRLANLILDAIFDYSE